MRKGGCCGREPGRKRSNGLVVSSSLESSDEERDSDDSESLSLSQGFFR